MQVQPVPFTASGLVGTAAHTGEIDSPLTGKPFTPFQYSGGNNVPAQAQRIAGFAYAGFTKVVAYNGVDNTGDVVFVGGGPGTYSFSYEVNCHNGLYVEVTGTGSGTAWLV